MMKKQSGAGSKAADARQGDSSGDQLGDEPSFIGHPGKRRRALRQNIIVPIIVMTLGVALVGVVLNKVAPMASGQTKCVVSAASVIPDKGVLLGVNLNWETETLAEEAKDVGRAPAVAVQFSDIPYDRATWKHTASAVAQLKANGGVLLLTLEPHAGLAAVSDVVISRLVSDLRSVNRQGVPVIVRFAHEMNGSWYAWGQQPSLYIETFRRVAAAIHRSAPGTSMMWAPNYGGGYPFTGGQFAARPGSDAFRILDTNKDGAVTMADDSYAPYYPGDAAVDWVGISLYHWGNKRPWGNNEITESDKFERMLTGTYVGTAGDDRAIPDFYHVYGEMHEKPVAIAETAAIYTPSRAGASELSVKRAWWRQVFDAGFSAKYPRVKMINWFEWKKYEIEINDEVDWRAAGSPAVRDAFVSDLPAWGLDADAVSRCSA